MPHCCSSNASRVFGHIVVLLRWTPSGSRYDCHSSDITRCFHEFTFASPSIGLCNDATITDGFPSARSRDFSRSDTV
ncbi:hypothetical protein LSAT2_012239 [Lamellibrachia satsuma]|nr:hypothetical protein LSAT2_012239 [Lamellibrachia satsuma]